MTDIHSANQFKALEVGDLVSRTQTVVLETGIFGFSGSLIEVYNELDAAWISELSERGIIVDNVTRAGFWNRFVGLDPDGDEIDELIFSYEIVELTSPQPQQVAQLAGFPWLIVGIAALGGLFLFGGVKLLDASTEFAKSLDDLSPNAASAIEEIGNSASKVGLVLIAILLLVSFKP